MREIIGCENKQIKKALATKHGTNAFLLCEIKKKR